MFFQMVLKSSIGWDEPCSDPGCEARREETVGPSLATKRNAAFASGATYDAPRSGITILMNEKISEMILYVIGLALQTSGQMRFLG
ncbi:hypothetical protein SAMN05421755_11002 [Nitrosomonas sp. Nm33]|nr:hypothetical protein SAMN05421755_11002 [Nitrosomonas sp. Nm33]